MIDQILKTRLTELKKTLERAYLSKFLPSDGVDRPAVGVRSRNAGALRLEEVEKDPVRSVRTYLESDLHEALGLRVERADHLEQRVSDLSKDPSPERTEQLEQAWSEYLQLAEECEPLLGEIVELMGGLAFRDRSVDPWFFVLADRLVKVYATKMGDRGDHLTLPSLRDTVTGTLAQIVRLRFPDWTVWALPLVGHEFACQFFSRTRKGDRLRRHIDQSLQQHGDPAFALDELERSDILLADALAAFTTGPAYLFASLGLRLGPGDADRAHMIIRLVGLLDGEGRYGAEFLDKFRKQWELSPVGQKLSATEAERIDGLADAVFSTFSRLVSKAASYPWKGWLRARKVCSDWREDARFSEQDAELERLNVPQLELVDVLNAAWLGRFEEITTVDRIGAAACDLCTQLLEPEPSSRIISAQGTAMHTSTGSAT